jgi:hypothetical protein
MPPRLRVSVGPDPDAPHLFQKIHLNAVNQPTHFESHGFTGNITVFVSDAVVFKDGTACATGMTQHPGSKRFSIQVHGRFNTGLNDITRTIDAIADASGRPFRYDDVLLGVELPKPVPWSAVPIPAWMVKMIWRWFNRFVSGLRLRHVLADAPSDMIDEFGVDAVWTHPSQRPGLETHLVSVVGNAILSQRRFWRRIP